MTIPAPSPALPQIRYANLSFPTSIAILLLRLILGWVFIYAGSQKLFGAFSGMGMDRWVQASGGLHLPLFPPAFWAWLSACSEFSCGIMVFLGLLTRLASIPLIIVMCVAIATFTGHSGFSAYQINLAMIAISTALILTGPGLISLDALIFQRNFWSRGPQPLAAPTAH